jgi:hypothetical protein
MSEYYYTAEEICAKLISGACSKELFPQLEYNERLRAEVKENLSRAGYEFVDDSFSNHFDARIKPRIRSINELLKNELGCGLTVPAKALIVILWCNLILPKLNPSMKKDLVREPTVTEEQLYENFKRHIGAKRNLRKTLTLLRQYGFIKNVWGQKNTIAAGPRLSTALDSIVMYNLIKENIIDFIILENEESREEIERVYHEIKNNQKDDGGNKYVSAN